MSLTKPEKLLVFFITLILFIVVNIFSISTLKENFALSIFSPNYDLIQRSYIKHLGNKVHPFYGVSSASTTGFDSPISSEVNFKRVSPSRTDNPISVLVLGGSVASHLSEKREGISEDYLLATALNGQFKTDRFVVYNAAFGGGKQPQQYFKLMYLDLLGFKPDIIINYDGFNEIALPLGENFNRDLNAIYPRSFDQSLISSSYDGSCFDVNNWLLSFNSYVPFLEWLKWIYIQRCHNESTGANRHISLNWPKLVVEEKRDYVDRAKLIWSKSSNKIADYALVNNIPYIHVLQPNQYLIGSKPLTEIEVRDFYNYLPYKKPIEEYYGSLKIESLITPNKIDQRYLFKNEKRTVYADACCHLNQLGMQLIIEDLIDHKKIIFEKLLEN